MLFAKLFSPASCLCAPKNFYAAARSSSSIWDFITFVQLYVYIYIVIYLYTLFVVAWLADKMHFILIVLWAGRWLSRAAFQKFPQPISSTRNAFGTFCWLECLIFMLYCMTLSGESRGLVGFGLRISGSAFWVSRSTTGSGYIVLGLVLTRLSQNCTLYSVLYCWLLLLSLLFFPPFLASHTNCEFCEL